MPVNFFEMTKQPAALLRQAMSGPVFCRLQATLEIITILCYTNRKRTVVNIKGARQHENNRGTAQRAQAGNDGKVL